MANKHGLCLVDT